MSFKVLIRLGFKTNQPYINVCAMDSREIRVCGIIKDIPKSEDTPKEEASPLLG